LEDNNTINIYIMGKKYAVPDSLTIMEALEYAGYHLVRGCGCRAGFCGACSTVYRLGNDYELRVGLACQTRVEADMYLAQLPFYPARKASYSLEDIRPSVNTLASLYPEIFKCLGCNSCTKVCPQDINVMQCIAYLERGDISRAAQESFDCLMCGLCVSRCPVNIVHYQSNLLARRLHSRYLASEAEHLKQRVEEIEQGKWDEELEKLMAADTSQLKEMYHQRDME